MLWENSTSIKISLKKFIDVGAGVIDADYRGEVGVILFNLGDEDFVVNMGDRIAQLIFAKIKTPIVKEMNELDGTDRGVGSYSSTRIKVVSTETDSQINSVKDKTNNGQDVEMNVKAKRDAVKNETLSQSRRLITA